MKVVSQELLSGKFFNLDLRCDSAVRVTVPAYGCGVFKFDLSMKNNDYLFNEHNKEEFPSSAYCWTFTQPSNDSNVSL